MRLKELAAVRVRFGYLRLWALLRREGWQVNKKRVYRLYRMEGLEVRTKKRRKIASQARVPLATATAPNQRWAMDFVSDRLQDGTPFRVLTVVDQFSRLNLALKAQRSFTAEQVTHVLDEVIRSYGAPQSITNDNGSEFCSRAMDAWAVFRSVQLDFIRPGKPVENSIIESFNGRLRDECLNVNVFFSMSDVQQKLNRWKADYNGVRPHGSLDQQSPEEFLTAWIRSRSGPLPFDLYAADSAAGSGRQGDRTGVASGHGLDCLRQLPENTHKSSKESYAKLVTNRRDTYFASILKGP